MTRKPTSELRRYRTGMPIGAARRLGTGWTVEERTGVELPYVWEVRSLHKSGGEAREAKAALEAEHGEFCG